MCPTTFWRRFVWNFILTAGLGGMGGAQPLAATFNGAVALCIEIDESRIDKRIKDGYCDIKLSSLTEALTLVENCKKNRTALSIGLIGNAAEILPEMLHRGIIPDIVTDQTAAHDPLHGYYPAGLSKEEADILRVEDPNEYLKKLSLYRRTC